MTDHALHLQLPLDPADIEGRLHSLAQNQKGLLRSYGINLTPLENSPGRYRLTKTAYRRIPLRLEITLTPTSLSQTDLLADFSTPPMAYWVMLSLAVLVGLALFLVLVDLAGVALLVMGAAIVNALLNYALYRYDQRQFLAQVNNVLA